MLALANMFVCLTAPCSPSPSLACLLIAAPEHVFISFGAELKSKGLRYWDASLLSTCVQQLLAWTLNEALLPRVFGVIQLLCSARRFSALSLAAAHVDTLLAGACGVHAA